MSLSQITAGVVIVGAFAALLVNNATQAERNATAQVEAARTYPVPAFSQQAARPAPPPPADVPSPAVSAAQAGGVTLHSVNFDFPRSDRQFPPGPGVELVTNSCTACHSPGMILTQPKLTQAEWTGEVNKMVHTYKAPVDETDLPAIVTYLASLTPTP